MLDSRFEDSDSDLFVEEHEEQDGSERISANRLRTE
jgi:hypothetical protein